MVEPVTQLIMVFLFSLIYMVFSIKQLPSII